MRGNGRSFLGPVILVCLGVLCACSATPSSSRRGVHVDAGTDACELASTCAADSGATNASLQDSGTATSSDAAADAAPVSTCSADRIVATGCMPAMASEASAKLCNGLDDDCDMQVDEGCDCAPGEVRSCFTGAPGRHDIGACVDGMQRCTGGDEFGGWGPCEGGIAPSSEACDGLDNDCNGCVDDIADCTPVGTCPAPGDPRVPEGAPFTAYTLQGAQFFSGEANSWAWTIKGGPCDELTPSQPSYTLDGAQAQDAVFTPKLSGDYSVTLTVTRADASIFTCTWIVHVAGPGLRIEMCYPENTTQDLDLHLKAPGAKTAWFMLEGAATVATQFTPAADQCDWANCEASLRGSSGMRADWGYAPSPLAACVGGPQGAQWQALGSCSNPRLDIDNNLAEGIGLPENINVDAPKEADSFRIMITNFDGLLAHPLVNVYCGGHRVATFGAAPDQVPQFTGSSGGGNVGVMWRVADVVTHVDAQGAVSCDITALHPPGQSSGFDVTYDDPRF